MPYETIDDNAASQFVQEVVGHMKNGGGKPRPLNKRCTKLVADDCSSAKQNRGIPNCPDCKFVKFDRISLNTALIQAGLIVRPSYSSDTRTRAYRMESELFRSFMSSRKAGLIFSHVGAPQGEKTAPGALGQVSLSLK